MDDIEAASGLYDPLIHYRIHVIVIPVISGDPNYDYSDLSAYLMYRLVPLSLDVIKEYQDGERIPGNNDNGNGNDNDNGNEYLFRAEVIATHLCVRRGPGSQHGVTYYISKGDRVKVFNLVNSWAAINIAETEWCYSRWLKRLY